MSNAKFKRDNRDRNPCTSRLIILSVATPLVFIHVSNTYLLQKKLFYYFHFFHRSLNTFNCVK